MSGPRRLCNELLDAAAAGDARRVAELLALGADADAEGPDGETPIALAIGGGHAACVMELLEPLASLGKMGAQQRGKALRAAAWARQPKCVRLLATKEAAREADRRGMDALMLSACGGDVESVEALLPLSDAMAATKGGRTALMLAAAAGEAACVRALLRAGDPLAADPEGNTALMYAAAYGHVQCVELLLPVSDAGAVAKSGRGAAESADAKGLGGLAAMIRAHALAMDLRASCREPAAAGRTNGSI